MYEYTCVQRWSVLRGDSDKVSYLGKEAMWRRDDPTVTSAVLNNGFYGEKLVAPYHHLQDKREERGGEDGKKEK